MLKDPIINRLNYKQYCNLYLHSEDMIR